ncbi:MAG: ABC transporter permease [Burkholderiales bacterium]|nr:ABC transporter permease [Burkholderiales bacterium]
MLIVLLLLWQLASRWTGPQWVPPPLLVASRFWRALASGDLWFHGRYTLASAVLGFLIGGLPGMALPFLLRRLPAVQAVLEPYLVAGYGAPKVALTPLFVIWFGIGLASKVALVAAVVFFMVLFLTAAGLRATDQKLIATARVYGADERLIAREIVWPAAVPYIFTSFRVAAPYAIGTAVVGELISSNRGLGYGIQAAATDFDPAGIFVGVVALAMLVIALNAVFSWGEQRLLAWKPTTGAADATHSAL